MPQKNADTLPAQQTDFLKTRVSKTLLIATLAMAVIYFIVLTFWFPRGNNILFALLIMGEIFHLWQAFGYIYTVWDTEYRNKKESVGAVIPVDIFITVAGEPVDIVKTTALAALRMRYPKFRVHLLNDGKVAKKSNWKEIETLAKRLKINCITREIPGGAKAGNINNALGQTKAPLVAIFDADQIPHADFLEKMSGYFTDPKMGFVQSPQYYKNYPINDVTKGAWEQQELFFGPICKGKNRSNSAFMCGTNLVIRRTTLIAAGGMCESNIAEDFLTSLFIHQQGWKSIYVPEVLAEGLAPEDFLSYNKQQLRWSRGSLEVAFRHNPLFSRQLTLGQKIQYLASATYYLSGWVVLLNAVLPLIFFYTGLMPLTISTMNLAAIFLPYIFLTILALKLSSKSGYTYRALAFSMSSFVIHIKATIAVLFNQKSNFAVTSKKQLKGNFLSLVTPHLLYIMLAIIGIGAAIWREGVNAAVSTNIAWALFNISIFLPFIKAALPEKSLKEPGAFDVQGQAVMQNALQPPVGPKVPTPHYSIIKNYHA